TRCYRDWSSDVCSSDLAMAHPSTPARTIAARLFRAAVLSVASLLLSTCARDVTAPPAPTELAFLQQPENLLAGHQFSQTVKVREIGRASCRERVWVAGG